MSLQEMFDLHEEGIAEIAEVYDAERVFDALLSRMREIDEGFAFELDSAVGALARAYEKQGFIGGYTVKAVV